MNWFAGKLIYICGFIKTALITPQRSKERKKKSFQANTLIHTHLFMFEIFIYATNNISLTRTFSNKHFMHKKEFFIFFLLQIQFEREENIMKSFFSSSFYLTTFGSSTIDCKQFFTSTSSWNICNKNSENICIWMAFIDWICKKVKRVRSM